MRRFSYHHSGFGIVEIIVVVVFLGIAIVGVAQLVGLAQRSSERSQNQKDAALFAEEAIEALVSLKRQDWTNNIANKTPDTTYYIARTASSPYTWQILSSDPGALYGKTPDFHRSIVFSRVYRDGSDNIVSSGTEDTEMRKVTITITWTERSTARSRNFETYIANMP